MEKPLAHARGSAKGNRPSRAALLNGHSGILGGMAHDEPLGRHPIATLRTSLRWLAALGFVAAGLNHFVNSGRPQQGSTVEFRNGTVSAVEAQAVR